MKLDIKKIIITNLPYLLFVYLFGKLSEAWRLAAGADLTQKMLHFMDSLAAAFANGLPSLADGFGVHTKARLIPNGDSDGLFS